MPPRENAILLCRGNFQNLCKSSYTISFLFLTLISIVKVRHKHLLVEYRAECWKNASVTDEAELSEDVRICSIIERLILYELDLYIKTFLPSLLREKRLSDKKNEHNDI